MKDEDEGRVHIKVMIWFQMLHQFTEWDYKSFDFRWLCWQFPVLHFKHTHACTQHTHTRLSVLPHCYHCVAVIFFFKKRQLLEEPLKCCDFLQWCLQPIVSQCIKNMGNGENLLKRDTGCMWQNTVKHLYVVMEFRKVSGTLAVEVSQDHKLQSVHQVL